MSTVTDEHVGTVNITIFKKDVILVSYTRIKSYMVSSFINMHKHPDKKHYLQDIQIFILPATRTATVDLSATALNVSSKISIGTIITCTVNIAAKSLTYIQFEV